MTLPVAVCGSASTTSTWRGSLNLASDRDAIEHQLVHVDVRARCGYDVGDHSLAGTRSSAPTTATSATPGYAPRTASTSAG